MTRSIILSRPQDCNEVPEDLLGATVFIASPDADFIADQSSMSMTETTCTDLYISVGHCERANS